MEAREIVQKLKDADYLVITSCNEVFKEGYHLGEVSCSKESKYLGKVLLFPWEHGDKEESIELENILMDNKIPFQHQKKKF
jgi:hypothetical protein